MFLPTTKNELNALGWKSPDVILVTGDTYVDSPFIGVAVIGKVLRDAGYTVAIIAQPGINSGAVSAYVDGEVATRFPREPPRAAAIARAGMAHPVQGCGMAGGRQAYANASGRY